MPPDDNEVWGPGEMTRALKRIETKVDEGNRTAITRELYERDRENDGERFDRIEATQTADRADVARRFTELTERSRWSTGNWLAIGLAVFSGAIALYTAFGHGGG
ncbi:hypothetical protein [Curtobacterium sp. MCBA15_004]|uniref:hypothetical protein n=1 Tax=Curtobacterium sp. MCBA15_004 TaxID=1898733 RepID=UPI0008DD3326|nr:hypothetical protein [Curtobacterium sp. MCBA15_004]WIA97612.1 hypothetical protein QOL16_04250 [Curtobacterium sp. MCBA15_004]